MLHATCAIHSGIAKTRQPFECSCVSCLQHLPHTSQQLQPPFPLMLLVCQDTISWHQYMILHVLLILQVEAGTPVIFAEGHLSGSGSLSYHAANRSPGSINFATGLAAVTADSTTSSYNRKLWVSPAVALAASVSFLSSPTPGPTLVSPLRLTVTLHSCQSVAVLFERKLYMSCLPQKEALGCQASRKRRVRH